MRKNAKGSRMRISLAVIFCAVLTFTMMPVMPFMTEDAHATTSYNLWIGTTQVTSDNASNVLAGTLNDGKVSYDPASQTLYLNSVNLTANNKNQLHEYLDNSEYYSFIYCWEMKLTIVLSGDNIVNTASVSDNLIDRNAAILSNAYTNQYGLIIKGDSKNGTDTLTATSGPSTGGSAAIAFYGTLAIDDCTVSATSSDSRTSGGLYAWNNSVITLKNGAKLTAVASKTAGTFSKGLLGNGLNVPSSSLIYDADCTIESRGNTYAGSYKITPDYTKSKVTVSNNYDGSSPQEITSGDVDLSGYRYIKISPKSVTPPAPAVYSITLNGNGGSGTDLKTYTYGTGAALPTDWTKDGYTFAGWYDNEGLTGNAVTAVTSTDSGAKTYYAKWKLNKPAVPKGLKANAKSKHSVDLTWTAADGASSYKIYKATGKTGKYTFAGKTTGTSFTVKKLNAGTKYYFMVKAVNGEGSAASKVVTAKTGAEPVSFTLTNVKGNNVKVHWTAVKGAAKYQVANNHTSNNKIKIKWTGNNSQNTYLSLRKTPGKTYKYKMRYYKVKNGKRVYSDWTSIKTIKVK